MAGILKLAKIVDDAAKNAKAIPQLSAKEEITVEEGYAIQSAAFSRRLARGKLKWALDGFSLAVPK